MFFLKQPKYLLTFYLSYEKSTFQAETDVTKFWTTIGTKIKQIFIPPSGHTDRKIDPSDKLMCFFTKMAQPILLFGLPGQ